MRKTALCAVTLTMIVVTAGPAAALDLGDAVPAADVSMMNVDGSVMSLAEMAGQNGLLVIFSCNHCPWVVRWEERIAELGNAYQAKGIGVVAVNSNDPDKQPQDSFEAMQQRAQERGFEFPYVVDATSDVARAFGAAKTPEAFLFDASGMLVYHGTIDDNAKEPENVENHFLRDALSAVAAGQQVGVQETKALGCTIKFREQG